MKGDLIFSPNMDIMKCGYSDPNQNAPCLPELRFDIELKNPLPDRADPIELHLVWTCDKMPNAIAIVRAPWSVGDLERELFQLFLLGRVAEQKTLTVGGISIPTGAVAGTHEIILGNAAQIFDLPGFDFHHDEVGL